MSLSISKNKLHHAYLIEGELDHVLSELRDLLGLESAEKNTDPDVHYGVHSSFGVDDAHTLSTTQSRKALGERKIFIVIFQTMTIEAQNALLKTLEEPTENTHFFFVTKNAVTLLSTLRSRMYFIRLEHKNTKKHDHDGEKFLRMSIPERMQFIEDFTKAKADEKAKAKESVSIFLDELLLALYEKFDVHPEFHEALLDVLTAKRYLLDRSPSVKILLEHLVLTIPQQEK